MLGVFAEFERSIIQERIAVGIAWARATGTRSGTAFGRPRLSAEREAAVRAALAEGHGIRKTARPVGTGNATVARIAAGCEKFKRLPISLPILQGFSGYFVGFPTPPEKALSPV